MISVFFLFFSLLAGQMLRIYIFGGASVTLLDLVAIGIVLVNIKTIFSWKNNLFSSALKKYMLCFIACAVISLVVNIPSFGFSAILISSLYLMRLAVYTVCAILVVKKFNDKHKYNFLRVFYIFTFLFSLLGLVQFVLYPDLRNLSYLGWDPHFGRIFSTFLDPNFAGFVMVMGILIGVSQCHPEQSKGSLNSFENKIFDIRPAEWDIRQRFFAMLRMTNKTSILNEFKLLNTLILFILISTLALTYSRSSYLSLIAGLIILSVVRHTYRKLSLIVVFTLFFLIIVSPKPIGEGGKLERASTVDARIENFGKYLNLYMQRPMLGYGFNTLKYINVNNNYINSADLNISHSAGGVDNSILFILMTTGIPGLIFSALIIIEILKYKDLLLSAIIFSLLSHTMFQNTIFYPQIFILAAVFVAYRINSIKKKSS